MLFLCVQLVCGCKTGMYHSKNYISADHFAIATLSKEKDCMKKKRAKIQFIRLRFNNNEITKVINPHHQDKSDKIDKSTTLNRHSEGLNRQIRLKLSILEPQSKWQED